jgi:hypothetical protein
LLEALQVMGVLSLEKMEFWKTILENGRERSWKYVKRPIWLEEDRIQTGHFVSTISIANVLNLTDSVHTVSSRDFESIIKVFASQSLRLHRDILALPQRYELGEKFMSSFLQHCHDHLGIQRNGLHPSYPSILIPPCYFTNDYIGEIMDARWGDIISVPQEIEVQPIRRFKTIEPYQVAMNPLFALWRKLGLVETRPLMRSVLGKDAEDIIRRIIEKDIVVYYEMMILEDIPEHLFITSYFPCMSPQVEPDGLGLDDLFGGDSLMEFE